MEGVTTEFNRKVGALIKIYVVFKNHIILAELVI